MIIVDIFVPSVDKTYNFSLNESADISAVIDEITEMIEQKERVMLMGHTRDLNLFDMKSGAAMPKTNSLRDCSIRNGAKLILV